MDKTNIVNTFTEVVDQLRNTECSQKEKISCFQRIAECIISPAMHGHINYSTFCSKAVNILLLFCEDLDSTCRIHAEENLNKIFRVLEKSRVHRILMDLYGEIKRNGNQRSLRICLRIFGYYAPQIREHSVRWYAQNLLPCLRVISRRKETLLQESLSDFVVKFGKYVQQGLTDSETCKLFEAFIENIGSDCAVKRRCTAQNCISLIEHACNKPLIAKYALNKVMDILPNDHQPNTIIGILGFLRQLVVVIIKGVIFDNDHEDSYSNSKPNKTINAEETRQLLEIYDYCLYLVSSSPTSQHSIINAALEVINSILQSLDGISSRDTKNNIRIGPQLLQLITDKDLKHVHLLRLRNTLKHQIFNLELDEIDRSLDIADPNKASESVSKLFRPGSSSTTPKNVVSTPSTTTDSLSLASNISSAKRPIDVEFMEDSSPESSKTFPTPSTAIMGEIRSLDSMDIQSTSDIKQIQSGTPKETPKKNPFLSSPSTTGGNIEIPSLPVDIGSMYEQTLLSYTARLIAARFLLTGGSGGLYDDSTVRVSIKSICLNVIAQCVRLRSEILEISLKCMASEKPLPQKDVEITSLVEGRHSPVQIPSDSSSNIGQDYEHLEVNTVAPSDLIENTRKSSFTQLDVFRMDDNEGPLLEIIDDHFGKSSSDFNFTTPNTTCNMTRSADPVLFSKTDKDMTKNSPLMKTKKDKLSTSEIIGADYRLKGFVEITKADEDMPPDMLPPKPPKRTKTFRKSKLESELRKLKTGSQVPVNDTQFLHDILYYYNHEDPILRAGIQIIIGQYCRSNQAGLVGDTKINLQYLLAILCMGLQDDIHTVVIQALNTFDKIFPYVLFKYMTIPTTSGADMISGEGHGVDIACKQTCHGRQQHKETKHNKEQEQQYQEKYCPKDENRTEATHPTARTPKTTTTTRTKLQCISGHFNDNDGIIAALLNAFQLHANSNSSNNGTVNTDSQDAVRSTNSNNDIMNVEGNSVGSVGKATSGSSSQQYVQTSTSPSGIGSSHCCGHSSRILLISPKLLLNKLRLCHYNKYWLVQNKYAEVISNLNYALLRSYYGNNYTSTITNTTTKYNGIGLQNPHHHGCSSDNCCCCCNDDDVAEGWFSYEDEDVDGTDFVCSLENSLLEELLLLIADDDVRVRESASKYLCRFILQNAKYSSSLHHRLEQQHQHEFQYQEQQQQQRSFMTQDDEMASLHRTYCDNMRMLQNFFEYSIFNDMSPAVRYLLNPEYQQRQQPDHEILGILDSIMTMPSSEGSLSLNNAIQTVLSKVLYRLTNKVMTFKDKNVQFGIIHCVKQLLKYFPFAEYASAWSEFNFMEIFVKLSQYNYNTAVDLACQSDLIDVSCKLIVGSFIFYPKAEQQNHENLISLLRHTMKIVNIYYHIFTNQRPLIMAKSQKVELFGNAKELAIAQSWGYFGNESIYLKLYQTLKSAYDNYKITINEEAGSKLISLLKTCLNSLSVCIEMLPHEATLAATSSGTINTSGGGSGSFVASSSHGLAGNIGMAKSATDVNATISTTASPSLISSPFSSSASSSAAASGSVSTGLDYVPSVLKLIEETLQYLTKVINYAPEESIACLRQLLKYLFARNYGNRLTQQPELLESELEHKHQMKQGHYPAFIKSYFKAKCKEKQCFNNQVDGSVGYNTITGDAVLKLPKTLGVTSPLVTSPSPSSGRRITTTNVTSKTMQVPPSKRASSSMDMLDCGNSGFTGNASGCSFSTVGLQDDYLLLSELFASGLEYHTWKSPMETELARHIKLFEPLVIYCLTLFLKCNGRVQAAILDMLILLLDLNVTYSSLDAKNVIFDHITKSLDIIEGGIARNGLYLITPMIKFLIKLSSRNERNLIKIPRIISITNNLLANSSVRDVAVQALKTLAYEIFLMTTSSSSSVTTLGPENETSGLVDTTTIQKLPIDDPNSLAILTENVLTLNNELDTQKEVILGMLEKFIESSDCQQLLSLLLLIEQLQQLQQSTISKEVANNIMATKGQTYHSSHGIDIVDVDSAGGGRSFSPNQQHHRANITKCLPNLDTVCNMICHSICSNRLCIQDWHTYYMVDTFFKNNTKYLLGNSKEFMALLKYIIEGDVANFSDLSYATIILSNVILKTEEIYLVNHIKLYLKNHPTTGEKLRHKQQSHHHMAQKPNEPLQQTANKNLSASHWLPDVNLDRPSTSSAAAKAAAAAATSESSGTSISPAFNEYNFFPMVLCNTLLECLQTLGEHRHSHSSSISNFYNHQFVTHYCRLVGNFVKVFNKLCSRTRLDDFLLVSIRSTLNGCESKLLNEYYNLLMMSSTQGCPASSGGGTSSLGSFGGGASTLAAGLVASTSGPVALGSGSGGIGGSGASPCSSFAMEHATYVSDDDNVVLQLQLEMFQLLNSVGVLDTLALLQRLQSNDICNHVRRALLNKVCQQNTLHAGEWNLQQVQHLFNGEFLNILIVEQFAFVCNLCEVDEEFCSLFQATVLANIKVLNKHSIVYLLRLVENLCKKSDECSILRFAKFLQILNKLHSYMMSPWQSYQSPSTNKRPLQLQIERLARHLIVNSSDAYDKNAIYDTFVHLIEEEIEEQRLQQQQHQANQSQSSMATTKEGIMASPGLAMSASSTFSSSPYFNSREHLQFMILNDLENSCELNDDDDAGGGGGGNTPLGSGSNIVDEKWIFNQLIKFSSQNTNDDPQQIVKILLEIQSENKLQKIFNTANFDALRILKHTISHSLQAMLQTFRNNCIQYNPHIHYMRPNPLARVSLAQLMTRIREQVAEGWSNMAIAADDAATKDPNKTSGTLPSTLSDDDTGKNSRDCGSGSSGGHHCHQVIHLCEAVIVLMENIKQIEVTALIYIESKFIDKFLSEHLLRPEHVTSLVRFIGHCCQWLLAALHRSDRRERGGGGATRGKLNNLRRQWCDHEQRNSVTVVLRCIDILLHQKFIWNALNQQQMTLATKATPPPATVPEGGNVGGTDQPPTSPAPSSLGPDACAPLTKCELNTIICSLLEVVSLAGTLLLENTLFYKKYKNALRSSSASTTATFCGTTTSNSSITTASQQYQSSILHPQQTEDDMRNFENIGWLTAKYNPKAIFLGKLIETKIGNYDKGICFGEYYNCSSSSTMNSNGAASSFSATVLPSSLASISTGSLCGNGSGACNSIDGQDLKGINNQFDFISLHVLLSIGISTLRTNLFYAIAVTPLEIMEQQQRLLLTTSSAKTSPSTSPSHKSQSATATAMVTSNSMLPIIPIESLSDVDILKSFVRRLSIFGFTTRQQFEEYFMTFLLLINKVYDENMVDQQEQFQIRSICLEAIMELLITYKTFPIVGNKLSLYHHTTRWNRINCDSISLKKLHEIQLIISPSNVFYQSNLERNLQTDSVIGTQYFGPNQFDLNFIWQQMEMNSSSRQSSLEENDNFEETTTKSPSLTGEQTAKHLSGTAANTAYRNYQYFTRQSGVDYKSSSQLIFDVLMQMIEQNHILILPNLVKFTEICENREQIKQIWEKADYLKSHIPMDDTISHQHLIYLLCKTKGMLIPSHMEMLNLEALIKNYLKSSHLFVRCAALNGLLSLLESYAKTNTTIGRLSDELIRLKDIILSYIDKHGLIEDSPLKCSDMHTKLIWTLNYSLMEWTSKLDPQCNVAYHTKVTANKLLKKSTNESIYLSVLHGLERMIVLDNKVSNISSNTAVAGGSSGIMGADSQNRMLRPSIEKLALELAKLENEKFSIPALKLLLSCIYVGSSKQLENTELSNGIVQDDPEIIAQQTDKVDILLQCIKTANEEAAWIYGQVLCQMIRDLVPPKEILTKVIKEFLAINQPHSDVIAMIVFQVFRSAIDSSFLQQLQDWLTCSLPTFLSLAEAKAVWSLSVVFLSASINLHLMKLFPLLLSGVKKGQTACSVTATSVVSPNAPSAPATPTTKKRMSSTKLGHHEIALFVTSAQDFYGKLDTEQKLRFRDAFKEFHHIKVYNKMLQSL
ncbi:huntingtin isoform X2 [Haematobia irritans]|uniref:huntingtin isoform X2 n=1 Tax=Haematobia irritans TaxID=7368 RepID=UPI003F4FD161